MVSDARIYAWSSAAAYLGASRPVWLVVDELLALFGPVQNPVGAYAEYLQAGVDSDTMAFYAAKRLKSVFDPPEYVETMGSDPFSEGV